MSIVSRRASVLGLVAALFSSAGFAQDAAAPAKPQDAASAVYPFSLPGAYHEIETKYIFGFTEGADIGLEGENAIESETNVALRRRHGGYFALEHEVELEGVPSQFFAYELSFHTLAHAIRGDDAYDDRHRVSPSGVSTILRYLLVGRGPGSPFGLTLSAEPEWASVDGDNGERTRAYATKLRALADTELIENRLFAAANVIYQPSIAKARGDMDWSRTSNFGVTGALAWRFTPQLTLGGEAEYYRAYDSLGFGAYQGNALFLGPTLHWQATKKIMVSAAYGAQVAGHAVGDDRRLDLVDFTRHRARLRLELEF